MLPLPLSWSSALRKTLPMATATVLMLASPVLAQNDVCYDERGNYAPDVTAGWQAFQANAQADAMQRLIGTWYTEIPNADASATAYIYQTYEPSGLFTAQVRTCDVMGLCRDDPAHGFWAAQQDAQGVITTMSVTSNTRMSNYCSLGQAVVEGNLLRNNAGQTWQRVQ